MTKKAAAIAASRAAAKARRIVSKALVQIGNAQADIEEAKALVDISEHHLNADDTTNRTLDALYGVCDCIDEIADAGSDFDSAIIDAERQLAVYTSRLNAEASRQSKTRKSAKR